MDDILKQAEKVVSIFSLLQKHYQDQDHVLVYDNVSTHQKWPDSSLSACKMPKYTSKSGSNWLVEVNMVNANGRQIYAPNRKILKTKIQMEDATFADGTKQPLYFPPGHEKAGLFKGMQVIMEERGLLTEGLLAQCLDFKCPNKGTTNCCCCQTLFNQPNFVEAESMLETYCRSCSIEVIFLPKFHCKLNFIEQCWGYAKRIYWHYPASSKEADLEQNLLASLKAVPFESMRKSICSVDTILHILTCYIDLHLALTDSWRHMRQVLMESWLCGLRRLTKDIACLWEMTY